MTTLASRLRAGLSAGIALRVLILLAAAAIVVQVLGYPRPPVPDSDEYRRMAAGDAQHVEKPFANRILHPLTVRAVSFATGSGPDTAFVIVSFLSAMALLFAVVDFTRQSLSVLSLAAMLGTPLAIDLLRDVYLPDLFHAGLVGLYLVALSRGRHLTSLAVLVALQLARESTVLLAFIVVVIALYRGRWQLAAGTAAASLLGIIIVAGVTSTGPSNIHGLGGIMYLLAKVPADFASNVLGVIPWTDTYAVHFPGKYAGQPLWHMTVPSWFPTGAIREVGVYRFDVARPPTTAVHLLTAFGILPTLVWMVMARGRAAIFRQPPLAISVAFGYGVAAYALAPMTGVSVGRLVGYAWPAFWIAVPVLSLSRDRPGHHAAGRLWYSYIACCWLPFLIGMTGLAGATLYVVVAAGAVLLHALFWWGVRSRTIPVLGF
jgi:hypothetical protein